MNPLISIIVPTFNRRASLHRLLDALVAQTHPASSFEVIVVDDGSSDGTLELLRSLHPAFELRALQQPHQGPAAARNLGVEHARGELILFLDDDVVPLPDLVERHALGHRAESDSVVIGPMRPPRDWQRPAWVRWEEELLALQYSALTEGQYACTPRQFYTANASLSRTAFLAAGGFDVRFKRAEDVELAWRMLNNGARFVFNNEAVVLHYAARTFKAWCSTPYQYGRYDVVMQRDKGHETLGLAVWEFHRRHAMNRLLMQACTGRPWLMRPVILGLRAVVSVADRLGPRGIARRALSGIYNLLYWQGVYDELGGAEPTRKWLAAGASAQ